MCARNSVRGVPRANRKSYDRRRLVEAPGSMRQDRRAPQSALPGDSARGDTERLDGTVAVPLTCSGMARFIRTSLPATIPPMANWQPDRITGVLIRLGNFEVANHVKVFLRLEFRSGNMTN